MFFARMRSTLKRLLSRSNRPVVAPKPSELLSTLGEAIERARAEADGRPTLIEIDPDGHVRAAIGINGFEMKAGMPGIVTIVDHRQLPVSRCVSGMSQDGKQIPFDKLCERQPHVEVETIPWYRQPGFARPVPLG